ncbi:aspartate--tRNA(Asp/Asn) ligase [Rhizocola hellebori]|uniref:Aspartate--tRNA(Asp/Asn) ligase n=1 Tax=Rhizocola hellebori TaxID=1392758 RepID=A0A8J3QEQ6_9ACTN|nr:aspartate--tRNA(Asn) ligase [Rhizocola hellebori]GIH09376.1 aspartate--tRNA(Asp/Asn) ligase [Rhizocola hellebori]
MQRILSSELAVHVGEPVTIAGWVHRRRELKSVSFLILRDRAGLAQVVLPPGAQMPPEETVIEVTGEVTANEVAPGGVELISAQITVLSGAEHETPFEIFRPTLSPALPTQLDHAVLSLRHPSRREALRLSAKATGAFRATLDSLGFTEIHTPKIVGSATESGSTVFGLNYFGTPAFLAQSPQFYKELMVGVFERVYEVGPVFRAEPHDTTRHLAEYTSLDAEMGFIADHRDVMKVLREVMAGIMPAISEIEVPEEIPAVDFAQALKIAGANPEEPDLAPADERAIGEWALREHGSEFIFVTGYPMSKRPFYTHPDPAQPKYSNGFDLLFRGLELVTGGQRLHRYEDYVAALEQRGEPIEPVRSYIESYKLGFPPHGGFAIGLERLIARVTGAANIREVRAFPRDINRLAP